MKAKRIVRGVLLGFVAISIGFAIAKEFVVTSAQLAEPPSGDRTVVFYMHATFRCATCNRVESTAQTLIATEFSGPVNDGSLEWVPVDFQQNEELADRYTVSGNMIVVVRFKDGKEVCRKRLANVMDLAVDGKWDRIRTDLRQAVSTCLAGE